MHNLVYVYVRECNRIDPQLQFEVNRIDQVYTNDKEQRQSASNVSQLFLHHTCFQRVKKLTGNFYFEGEQRCSG